MIEKIMISLIAFLLFFYVFIFKLIKKNDTTYLVVLIIQAVGILLNFVHILFNIFSEIAFKLIIYVLCIIVPLAILILENKGVNFSEIILTLTSRMFLSFGNRKKAKECLFNLVSKYDKSYRGHKMLAEIYEKEGGMRKAIDEYVKVLDIKGNDYNSYFKISELLNDLGKKDESIQMLKELVKKKPELCKASKALRRFINRKRKV